MKKRMATDYILPEGCRETAILNGKELRIGKWYILIIPELDEHKKKHMAKKRLRLVGLYKHQADFVDVWGIHRTYRYWDLAEIMEETDE